MKKWIACLLITVLCFSLFACASNVEVKESARVTLTFNHGGKRIQRALNQEESNQIIEIINNKRYFDMSWDTESCSFDKNVALTVDGTVFAVAKDSCGMLKDLSNDELILLTDAEHSVIVTLFDTYGGILPCLDASRG